MRGTNNNIHQPFPYINLASIRIPLWDGCITMSTILSRPASEAIWLSSVEVCSENMPLFEPQWTPVWPFPGSTKVHLPCTVHLHKKSAIRNRDLVEFNEGQFMYMYDCTYIMTGGKSDGSGSIWGWPSFRGGGEANFPQIWDQATCKALDGACMYSRLVT